jgi:hypothetical protein
MDPLLLDVDQISGGRSEHELGERDEPEILGLGDGTLGVAVGGTAVERLSRGGGDAMGDGGSGSDGEHFDIRVLRVGLRRVCCLFPRRSISIRTSLLRDQARLAPRALLFPRTSPHSPSCPSLLRKPSQPRVSKPAAQIPGFPISSDSRSDADCSSSARFLSSSVL